MSKNIRLRVKNLIKKYNTSDPFLLCKKLNIILISTDIGTIKGYYKHPYGRKVIVINSKLKEFTQKIVLSHELGHAVLHSNRSVALMHDKILHYSSTVENEANKFAAELLLNDYDTDNIESCDYYNDEISTDENDRKLLERLREIKFSNKYKIY